MRRLARIVACLMLVAAMMPVAPVAAEGPGFHLELVTSGYGRPLYVAAGSSPNRLYVVEQRGLIKVLKRASATSPWQKAGVFLDLRSKVTGPFSSRGLLGMAFDPNYASNGLFFVFYARKDANPDLNGDIVIVAYHRRTSTRAKASSARLVLVVDHPQTYHLGGWIGFGPDGYMYATIGDGADDPAVNAQNINLELGKVLRFDAHKANGDTGFVPADNPFVGVDGDDLVWAYGLRHPWRASFDSLTGDLWIGDPGEVSWEEVDHLAPYTAGKGANFGWSLCEGSHAFPPSELGPASCDQPTTTPPTIEFSHDDGHCSVIGGFVYRGTAQPALVGRYFFGDYCTGSIWAVPTAVALSDALPEPLVTGKLITSFGQGPGGEIYMTSLDGSLWHVVQD